MPASEGKIDAGGNFDGPDAGTAFDQLRNIATADTDQTDAQSDDATTPVTQAPAFTIAKDVTSVDGAPNTDNHTLSLHDALPILTNTGNESLTGVTLTDPFATTVSATHTGDTV